MNDRIEGNHTEPSEAATSAEIQADSIQAANVAHVVTTVSGEGPTTPTFSIKASIKNRPAEKKLPSFVGRGSRFTDAKNLSALFDDERRGKDWYDTL
ncbi:hypothetical protein SAMN04487912_102325 [Arthrobacter sp. cf158]|nr:hypothetical protein SAMN04487912_102325 [Arthrobacter sp. cf158]